MNTKASLAAARAAYVALGAALAALDGTLQERDDDLIELGAGCYGIAGQTLIRWARSGRLRAFEAERGRLVAWRSEVRRAIEAQPARQLRAVEDDPLEAAIASGTLRAGGERK